MSIHCTFPVTLSSVSFSCLINVSEYTFIKSVVIYNSYFIILLVSDNVINTLKFLEEDRDNFVNNFNIISKSFNFSHIEISMSLEFNFRSFNSSNTVFPVGQWISFMSGSKNKVIFKFGSISCSSVKFNLKNVSFFFWFLDISDGISSSSNFSFNKVFHGLFKMSGEFIKSGKKLWNNINFNTFSYVLMF